LEKHYQEELSCLVLPTCLRKNINQLKIKVKSIYQNLVETILLIPTSIVGLLWSVDLCVSEMSSLFFYLSVSLSTSFVPTRSAYLDYNMFNLQVAMCDNDNVVTDEVKLINKLKIKAHLNGIN
jgi:dimeric dUTPase (all-alpha-NTP-PPase superfamily)